MIISTLLNFRRQAEGPLDADAVMNTADRLAFLPAATAYEGYIIFDTDTKQHYTLSTSATNPGVIEQVEITTDQFGNPITPYWKYWEPLVTTQSTANSIKGNPTATTADTTDILVPTNSVVGRLSGNLVTIPILDEDDMVSDSDSAVATQQSIKAYVDSTVSSSSILPGPGIIETPPGTFTLDLASTTIVTPSIVAVSPDPIWTINKNDLSPYTIEPTSNSSALFTEIGCSVNMKSAYQYPAAGPGQGLPTSATSSTYSTTLPGPATQSATATVNGITTNNTYSITLLKPKSGLVVVSNQVQFPTGNDSSSASISVTFRYRTYLFYSTSNSLATLDATTLSLAAKPLRTNNSISGSVAVTYNNVTASLTEYTYLVYPAVYSALASVIQDSTGQVIGAFTPLSNINVTTDSGQIVACRVYVSNATGAFTNNNLAFS